MTRTVNGLDELTALAGTDLGHSGWMEITQERVDTFADATGDHQWIHVDTERAKAGPFGRTIAHGYLTLALIIPMFGELLSIHGIRMGINYGLNKVRFPAPVPVGGRIRLHGKVVEATPISGSFVAGRPAGERQTTPTNDGVQLTVDFTVELEGSDKPACAAQAVYRQYA